jgi:hypothetical protein
MTSFTHCLWRSFTLRASVSSAEERSDAVEEMQVREQRVEFVVRACWAASRSAGYVCEFGISRPTGYLLAGALSGGRRSGYRRAQPSPAQSPTQTAPELESVHPRPARGVSGLGRAQAGRAARARGHRASLQHHPSRVVAPRSGARRLTGTRPPSSASSASSRTSSGRWTSRDRRTGPSPRRPCR